MCGRDDDTSMIDQPRLTTLLREPHQHWCSCLLSACDCGRDQTIVEAAGVTVAQPAPDAPCIVCGFLRNSGTHDTVETCDEVRGPCLDPQRHHPYQSAPNTPQPAPDAPEDGGETFEEYARQAILDRDRMDAQPAPDPRLAVANDYLAMMAEIDVHDAAQPAPDAPHGQHNDVTPWECRCADCWTETCACGHPVDDHVRYCPGTPEEPNCGCDRP